MPVRSMKYDRAYFRQKASKDGLQHGEKRRNKQSGWALGKQSFLDWGLTGLIIG